MGDEVLLEEQEPPAPKWTDLISEERQAELQGHLDRWLAETEHGERKGPFDLAGLGVEGQRPVHLTGADVFWLAEQRGYFTFGYVSRLHLEGADLRDAHLEGAILYRAHLEGADLTGAYLAYASLTGAYLGGASLEQAHLEGARLQATWMDSKTVLSNATLDATTSVGDVQWSGVGAVNLTRLNWNQVPTLGDEQRIDIRSSVEAHEAAVRAYRQLAAQLRAQGMSEVADRFAERAQVRQRKLLFRQMLEDWRRPWRLPSDLLRWLFSWFLALLAGYGFHPGRSVFWYLATIAGFAALYLHFGVINGHFFNPTEAVVFSLTSFHGRGFFPGGLPLDAPVTVIAAGEAIIGLLIEISFIATFTQRFFGSR